ncbi:MAG: pantetheine-phosphate adenylyltransferase [Bifidobacteriaceae bacterium]|jgi:pantetheine-phosphate adenylyltransferase|nr:pantetheine-phosphate adenylyltransferase [Bifidobacteriaceae bacterium]
MKSVLYPGSFDPITLGHLNIIERATRLFDELIICVASNVDKHYIFSHAERVELVQQSLADMAIDNVKVVYWDALIIDACAEFGAGTILRGIRNMSDLNYEMQFSQINNRLSNGTIDTLFMTADEVYINMSSTQIREIAMYNGKISDMVTKPVENALKRLVKFSSANDGLLPNH